MADDGTFVLVIRKDVPSQDEGIDLYADIKQRLNDLEDLKYSGSFSNHYEEPVP